MLRPLGGRNYGYWKRPSPVDVGFYLRYKGLLSPFLGALLAIPLLPIMGIIYVLVRLTSSGPGFYSQVRLGLNGKRFRIYKFRSMVVNAEAGTGPVWAKRNDPRITRIGKCLRRYHLDELPQIFNIIRGDMCFVGPRPERPEIAISLAQTLPGYMDRLAIKPGITGMAQLHLPADTCASGVRRKLSFDLAYIKRTNLLLDLRVALATSLKVLPIGYNLPMQLSHCREFLRHAGEMTILTAEPIQATCE